MASTASTPGSAPKAMSSRLLTMKFMQRAAASSPATPSPPTPEERSPKRRKKDSDSSPSRFNVDSLTDRAAIQAALVEEEAKRQAVLERQAAEAGDTRWVLSFEDQKSMSNGATLPLRIVQAGYANLDGSPPSKIISTDDDFEDKPVMIGRRSFGRFNRAIEKQQDPSLEDLSDTDLSDSENQGSESESGSEEADGDSKEVNDLIKASRQEAAERAKAERNAKKKAAQTELLKLSKKRKKTEVKLNGLTSLTGRQDKQAPAISCYNCGGPHKKAQCPQNQNKRGFNGDDDGPPRKSLKSR